MGKAFRFTTARLEKLTCPAGKDREYFRDEGAPGLSVCVTAAGAKTFVVYKRVRGRPVRVRLGSWPDELGIDPARKLTLQTNAQIARGEDPREAKVAARGEITLGRLMTLHIEYQRPRARTWRIMQRRFELHLSRWKSRRLSDITRGDVQALHARLGERHGKFIANRMVSLLSTLYARTGTAHGWTGPNPAKGIERFREKSRTRFLHADELPRFFLALNGESELFKDFFLLLLLTGARRGNVLAMRWDDVHLDRREWTIPASEFKTGEAMTVALVPEAVDILTRRRTSSAGPWVFPSYGASGHIITPKFAWQRILARAGLADLRIHDLRRTYGSWMTAAGTSLPIVGKALGHRSQAATAVYARLNLDHFPSNVDRFNVGDYTSLAIFPPSESPHESHHHPRRQVPQHPSFVLRARRSPCG
jgi:integrase